MSLQQRAILINVAILVGLVFEHFKGVPIRPLLVSGLLEFSILNFALWLRRRSLKRSKNAF